MGLGLLIGAALALAGCGLVPGGSGPERPETGDEVRFGSAGSADGGRVTSVYATDQVAVASWERGEEGREDLRDLPEGTFERLVPLALSGIAAIPPDTGEVCTDYGTDFVEVTVGRKTTEVTASCRVAALRALQSMLSEAAGVGQRPS